MVQQLESIYPSIHDTLPRNNEMVKTVESLPWLSGKIALGNSSLMTKGNSRWQIIQTTSKDFPQFFRLLD